MRECIGTGKRIFPTEVAPDSRRQPFAPVRANLALENSAASSITLVTPQPGRVVCHLDYAYRDCVGIGCDKVP